MKELDLVLKMWAEDAKLPHNLEEATRLSPTLHSKYLTLLSQSKQQLKRLELAQKKLLQQKWVYYNGKMDKEQIEALGWPYDPLNGLRVLKTDMDRFYDADPDIQKSVEQVESWKNLVATLSEILENIKWRHQNIGNIIRWKVFEAGG